MAFNINDFQEHPVQHLSNKETAIAGIKDEGFINTATDENYEFPPIDLLRRGRTSIAGESPSSLQEKAMKLENLLKSFNVEVTVTNVTQGTAVTRYEVYPNSGVRVKNITNLADDIALHMVAKSIRIEAPIQGKPAVGIEIENEERIDVSIHEMIASDTFQNSDSKITFVVGKDIGGKVIVADLEKMPHLLIAGSTGSGKSVFINSIITSLLYKARPDQVKMILIDPKVVELSDYNGIPHLLIPVVTDPSKAVATLNWAVTEMDERYRRFAEAGVRDITAYNTQIEKRNQEALESYMPQIVIIIDELADLMMASPVQIEKTICRLAQKAKAAGIHLIVATQRPSFDVITGRIKENIPSRIAFAVYSQFDSRSILDMDGAEKLIGSGDMLFRQPGTVNPARIQGAFISDYETRDLINFVKSQGKADEEKTKEVLNRIKSAYVLEDVKKQIVELVLGEPLSVRPEDEDYFEDAFARMLEDFSDDEITHVLNVVSGVEEEDELFHILIRKMRHPLRTRKLRGML